MASHHPRHSRDGRSPEEWEAGGGGQAPSADAAFRSDDEAAAVERAASILSCRLLAAGGPEGAVDVALASDAAIMGIPRLSGFDELLHGVDGQRTLDDRTAALTGRLGLDWAGAGHAIVGDTSGSRATEAALWRHLKEHGEPDALLALLDVSLGSGSELQRVAAAAALNGSPGVGRGARRHPAREALPGERPGAQGSGAGTPLAGTDFAARILEEGCRASDPLVAGVARAALGVAEPASTTAATGAFVGDEVAGGGRSIAIHGTWGRLVEERWSAPGSELFELLAAEASPSLYRGEDYFRWGGGYDDAARADGTEDLLQWVDAHGAAPLDTVFAHSHGGSVALAAAGRGERIGLLVLLHTPALPRPEEEWERIRAHIGRTLVMRTRLDLVVLADALRNGSAQRFDPEVLPHRELALNWNRREGWFDHGFFLQLETWRRFDLAAEVRYEHSLVPAAG